MRRVPEVLDCWFESGSMPFAQVHYPFENTEWFEHHYPGDFIVEYIGQTRGWFYTLHVLATALFDRPAFSNCVSHGIVLGDDGRKMSKSLRNYPDPTAIFDSYGADAMRWYLLSSTILRGSDLAVTEQGMRDTVRQVLLPLWNAWYFLGLYANADDKVGSIDTSSTNVLDRYVLAKARTLVAGVTEAMDAYDLFSACGQIRSFFDVLTNWYIRRSRDRFWAGEQAAIDTLHTVLEVVCRLAAPLLPLTTEAVYKGLTGERSVHMTSWPSIDELPADDELVMAMDQVRDVCSATLSVRKAQGRRVRLPLSSLTVAVPGAAAMESFADLIADEVNVKAVHLTEDVASLATSVLQVVPAVVGPRLGGQTQQVIKAVKTGDWHRDGENVVAGGVTLLPGEFTVKLVASGDAASAALEGGDGVVVLDIEVTPELEAEGLSRDLVRLVQQARRDAGFAVSDRIALTLGVPEFVRRQLAPFIDTVAAETLATSVAWGEADPSATVTTGMLGDDEVSIGVVRA
jgi:isoleucyl-tRNA synthetase